MSQRKIALCITDLDIGGAEQSLVALATRLDRSRFAPVVYCLGPEPALAQASCVPPLREAEVEVHCLGARGALHFLATTRQLRRHFERQGPDLVQTFLFHANVVGRVAARKAGVRRVVCGLRVAERRSRWHLWVDRLTSRMVDRYVCVSQSVARFSATTAGLPPDRLVVIPNGVDLDRYPAGRSDVCAALGIPAGRRLVSFVGRLEPQKGLPWLLESAQAWLARLPDHDLVIVGKGPDQPRLQKLCRQGGIASRVHFVGWRRDVPEILAGSELLVLPSRWEGMPNVVLQAMASRLPVLATDVEGVRELLGEEAGPQIVPFGDTRAWAENLVRILTDRGAAAALGRKNRQRAEQQFSIGRMVRSYEELWTSLAAGGA